MRLIKLGSLTTFALLSIAGLAQAQSADVYFGLGTVQASAANLQSNTFGDGTIYGGTRMGGLFGNYGGDFLINDHFGIGAESSFRFNQGAYAGLEYRPMFYDFNGIWLPTGKSKRFVPELQAGLGGVNLSYYYPPLIVTSLLVAPRQISSWRAHITSRCIWARASGSTQLADYTSSHR